MSTIPVTPLAAATLLLLRDGAAGLEVLMTTRHAEAGFAGGAMVFPGGKVNIADEAYANRHAAAFGLEPRALAFRVAALRETYEESALLVARRPGETAVMSAAEIAALHHRHGGQVSFPALLDAGEIEPPSDLLVPFAHWITPRSRPKRFDTHFFLAPAPSDQVPRHDGREAIDTRWMAPLAAVAEAEAGRVSMVFATRMNLTKLGRSRSVAQALDAARRDTIVTVVPERAMGAEGPVFRIPEAAGYGAAEVLIGNTPPA
jgi:8-oxo-dGTP pyrophosphatase MutT (NUDIX family)